MNILIVESPAKAKTINKYLGSEYKVLASFGHVRDLPSKNGSVLPENDFAMKWEMNDRGAKQLSEIIKALKGAQKLILATDPDREGEAIAWHVLEILKDQGAIKSSLKIERVVFNAITQKAVAAAMQNPRNIDIDLVDAYLARRALDYLVGFTLSPVLWRKLPGTKSAGRVQSVTLRLICEREQEIESFKPQEYWSIIAKLQTPAGHPFNARVVGFDGKKITRLDIKSEAEAITIKEMLEKANFLVENVESKPVKRNPWPPFVTSTLQQAASYELGFSAQHTMRIAQRLYEGVNIGGGEAAGLITYMRTDSTEITPEAVGKIREMISAQFGPQFLPDKSRRYVSKVKNAQEAHEAIRPTEIMRHPKDLAAMLDGDQARLYDLIWKRTIASQMESALLERTAVDLLAVADSRCNLRATGSILTFPGFLILYDNKQDDDEDEDAKKLPVITVGDKPSCNGVVSDQHFTEPPPRYTEATIVKKMEELGIGRPSTYAAMIQVLCDRNYIRIEKRRLFLENRGRVLTLFLEEFFKRYVEYDFTANLEEDLDKISNGDLQWKSVLLGFWQDFSSTIDTATGLRTSAILTHLNDKLDSYLFPVREDGRDPHTCPNCAQGHLSLKMSKFGPFVGCSQYPECSYVRQLHGNHNSDDHLGQATQHLHAAIGVDPVSGLEITLRNGRFGPYIQLGNDKDSKRASLPSGWAADNITLEKALRLLSLPREVGVHPSGGTIIANRGRFGPFIQHEGTYVRLPSLDDAFEIGLNRAVSLLAEKIQKGLKNTNRVNGRILGNHPEGGEVILKSGRYGPYVSYKTTRASLPKDTEFEDITLEEALALLRAKNSATDKPKTKKPSKKKLES